MTPTTPQTPPAPMPPPASKPRRRTPGRCVVLHNVDWDMYTRLLKVFAEKGTTRRQATEDVLWALLNTPELVFVD